jgi:hypothetical protein
MEEAQQKFAFEDQAVIDSDLILQQLKRVLTIPAFEATESQKAFLRFIVEQVLNGKSSEIKGYTVAT